MKKATLFLIFSLFQTIAWNQCVQQLNSGVGTSLHTVWFTQSNRGYIAGDNGVLRLTTDGGTNWTPQDARTALPIRDLYFTDNSTGWAVGDDGLIRYTIDGGTTWEQQHSPTRSHLYSIAFSTTGTGLITGACGLVLRTIDAGTTWTLIDAGISSSLYAVHFLDATTVLAAGANGSLIRSIDGGLSWSVISGVGSSDWTGLASDGTTAWCTGTGIAYSSTNNGSNWSATTLNNGADVAITAANIVYLVGSSGAIQESRDAGTTSNDLSIATVTDDLVQVMFPDSTVGYAVGQNGALVKINYFYADAAAVQPICEGQNLSLSAVHDGSGASYDWSGPQGTVSNQQNPTVSNIAPNMAGLYTFSVTINGCTQTDTTTVTVNPMPNASIIGNAPICEGESISLLASGGDVYLWDDGTMNAENVLTPTSNDTYFVTVTDANTCTSEASAQVVVNPAPNVSIMGNTTLCEGENTILTASGGNAYSWSNSAAGAINGVSPLMTTTYMVTVTDNNACSAEESVQVIVNPAPNASITGNTTLCDGESTTLTATGGNSYIWDNGTMNAANPISPATTTTYLVTVTDANTCTNEASVQVTVGAAPTATITGNTTLCEGESTTLTATGGNSYVWDNGPMNANNSISPTMTTSYMVTVTNASSCTATQSVQVVVNAVPNASIMGNTTLCEGDNTILTASGGNAYSWSNNVAGATNAVSPLMTTTYMVTVTDANTCSTEESVQITVNPAPNASITGNTTLCEGESTTLIATGGNSYVWDNGPMNAANPISPATTTTYLVTVTDANTCTNEASVQVTVSAAPTAAIGSPPELPCTDGTPIALDATNSLPLGNINYEWSTTDGAIANGGNSANPNVIEPGNYTLIVTHTGNGCRDTAMVEVVLNAIVQAQAYAGVDTAICSDSYQMSAILPPNVMGEWMTNAPVTWDDPTLPNATISGLPAGNHQFTWMLSTDDCDFSEATITIATESSPVAEDDVFEFLRKDNTFEDNVLVNDELPNQWRLDSLTAPLYGDLVWDLQTGTFTYQVQTLTPLDSFSYRLINEVCPDNYADGLVQLRIENNNGEILIGITPNNDGNNDQLRFTELDDPTAFPAAWLVVFNRWGSIVYDSRNFGERYNNDWGGTLNNESGKPLPAGTYFFILRLDIGKAEYREGEVTIIR